MPRPIPLFEGACIVDAAVVTVRVDETGARVELCGDAVPDTVFRGDPAVVLGLASGLLTMEQAVAGGELTGREEDLAVAFG